MMHLERHIHPFEMADRMYRAYIAHTNGKSAVTGAELPAKLEACPQHVINAWIASATHILASLEVRVDIERNATSVELSRQDGC